MSYLKRTLVLHIRRKLTWLNVEKELKKLVRRKAVVVIIAGRKHARRPAAGTKGAKKLQDAVLAVAAELPLLPLSWLLKSKPKVFSSLESS